MLSQLFGKLKLHAPPVALTVAILAWIFGNKVSGPDAQAVGEVVALLLGGAAIPSAANGAATAVQAAKAKLAGK